METTTETVITKEEFPALIQKEFERWLWDTPSVRYQLMGIMVELFAQKTDLQAISER